MRHLEFIHSRNTVIPVNIKRKQICSSIQRCSLYIVTLAGRICLQVLLSFNSILNIVVLIIPFQLVFLCSHFDVFTLHRAYSFTGCYYQSTFVHSHLSDVRNCRYYDVLALKDTLRIFLHHFKMSFLYNIL